LEFLFSHGRETETHASTFLRPASAREPRRVIFDGGASLPARCGCTYEFFDQPSSRQLSAAVRPKKKKGVLKPLQNKAFKKVAFFKFRPTFEMQKKELFGFWAARPEDQI
jgi:hypothetical protein